MGGPCPQHGRYSKNRVWVCRTHAVILLFFSPLLHCTFDRSKTISFTVPSSVPEETTLRQQLSLLQYFFTPLSHVAVEFVYSEYGKDFWDPELSWQPVWWRAASVASGCCCFACHRCCTVPFRACSSMFLPPHLKQCKAPSFSLLFPS